MRLQNLCTKNTFYKIVNVYNLSKNIELITLLFASYGSNKKKILIRP